MVKAAKDVSVHCLPLEIAHEIDPRSSQFLQVSNPPNSWMHDRRRNCRSLAGLLKEFLQAMGNLRQDIGPRSDTGIGFDEGRDRIQTLRLAAQDPKAEGLVNNFDVEAFPFR